MTPTFHCSQCPRLMVAVVTGFHRVQSDLLSSELICVMFEIMEVKLTVVCYSASWRALLDHWPGRKLCSPPLFSHKSRQNELLCFAVHSHLLMLTLFEQGNTWHPSWSGGILGKLIELHHSCNKIKTRSCIRLADVRRVGSTSTQPSLRMLRLSRLTSWCTTGQAGNRASARRCSAGRAAWCFTWTPLTYNPCLRVRARHGRRGRCLSTKRVQEWRQFHRNLRWF